jgi:hypothetical protein
MKNPVTVPFPWRHSDLPLWWRHFEFSPIALVFTDNWQLTLTTIT